ncbi:MAG: hypothetical protein ACYSWU_14925 [Planctomycetota bacterium]|jgi:hypothetical protein
MFSDKHLTRAWPSAGVVLAWLLCGLAGCGSGEPFDMLPVSGKVTYEDGSLISAARVEVTFGPQAKPIDGKTYPRPGRAEVNVADGTFSEVTSHKYGDGLVLGKHKIKVFSYDQNNVPTELAVEPSEIEVGPGSTEFEFTVKKR